MKRRTNHTEVVNTSVCVEYDIFLHNEMKFGIYLIFQVRACVLQQTKQ